MKCRAMLAGSGAPLLGVALLVLATFGWSLTKAQESASQGDFAQVAAAASAAREAGHTTEAIRLYQQAVTAKPDWAEGWWYLGTLRYDVDQFASAIPAFQALTRLMPQNASAWNFLGLSQFETGSFDEAKAELEKGLALRSTDDDETERPAVYHLALLRNRGGDFRGSMELLTKEFAKGPIPEDAKFAFGLATLHIALLPNEVEPSKDSLIAKVGEAASLGAQGKTEAARQAYADLVAANASVPFLRCAYAAVLEAAGDKRGALTQYGKELEVYPENVEAKVAKARLTREPAPSVTSAAGPDSRITKLYLRAAAGSETSGRVANDSERSFEKFKQDAAAFEGAGKWDETIISLQKALAIRPDWDDGLWKLATLTFAQDQMEESLRALKSWTGRNPNSGTAWAMIALCEFSLQDFENSLVHFERAESLGFSGAQGAVRTALYRYALLEIHAGRFAKAQQILADRRLNATADAELQFAIGLAALRIAKFPQDLPATQNPLISKTGEAMALLYVSKYDEGLPKLKALIDLYPSAPMLHFLYGKALSALSNYEEAAQQFLLETKISPGSPSAYVDLALTRLQQHRAEDALAPAEMAAKLAPESAEAHYVLGRTHLELRQDETAQRELEAAARLAPSSPEVHFNLAKAYARRNQPEKAAAERAIFTRLNEVAEKQKAGNRNQNYGEARGETALSGPPNGQTASPEPN